ncbi:MAG: DUF2066 domain-containing protein [Cellvibrionaceae bacterium]
MALLLIFLSMGARAELVDHLYQQSELVLDQSDEARQRAAQSALSKVLVRVSGRATLLELESIQQVLGQSQRFVEAYRYESTGDTLVQDGVELPASRLVLNFSRSGIERLLREQQAPLWPANRPSVLVWLVKDDLSVGRELVSLQAAGELAQVASQVSKLRGLPMVLPSLDLQDLLNINADQVWTLDQAAIIEASARYRADVILVGRYTQTSSGRWLSAWTLLHKQHQQVFDIDTAEEGELVAEGLAAATDFLASIYSISSLGGATESVTLEVQQVNGFTDYVQVLNYLDSLEVVRQLDLVSLAGQSIRLRVKMEGEIHSLEDALELDRRLQPTAPQRPDDSLIPTNLEPVGSDENPLLYRWPS